MDSPQPDPPRATARGGHTLWPTQVAAPSAELHRRAWAVISDVLRNGAPEDRAFAAQMLGRIEAPEAVRLLCEALRSRASSVRAAAANAFRTTRQPVPTNVLAASLRNETDPWRRVLLVEAIARSADPQRGQMIRPAFRDPDKLVRLIAYSQIWRLP
ncbi:MAG: HEAT repeat domain-containing protein [Rhodospirillales bacterium]